MNKIKLRILVVDDSPVYLKAISSLLSTFPFIQAIERALTASEALEKIRSTSSTSLAPDLVLLDIALPDGNGLDVARLIKAAPHPPKVVMVTLSDTPAYRAAAKSAGTDGFLGKSDLGERLHSVISELFPQICASAR
jgi:DNA-binding NarL/FixJ family response regulator